MKKTAKSDLKITVYSAQRENFNMFDQWAEMCREIYRSRELIWRLMIRDFTVRYRQSYLGYIWAVLPQIVTVAIFTFLARHRVFDMGQTTMPYVIHALWSLSVWQLFSSCLIGCTNSLVNAGSLVTKINFPKEALVLASLGQCSVDFVIRLIPVGIVFFWYGFIPSWQSAFLPLILIAVLLMALGVGFIMAIINLVLRDIGNMVSMILTFGMFLSPILYPPPQKTPFDIVNYANPFSPLLISSQNLISGQTLAQPSILAITIVLSIFIFLLGWRMFHITMPRIAERA